MLICTACTKNDEVAKVSSNQATEQGTKSDESPKYKAFGDSVQSTSQPLQLAVAVKSPDAKKIVRIEAKVVEVCQRKGCWMVLTDGSTTMRVMFKDYAFFMPKDITGKTVIAEGIVEEEVLTEENARHYAEDAGKSQSEIEKIKGDTKIVSMTAQSVFVMM